MEAQWQADRAALRDLLHTRPDLSLKEMARRLNRSYSWVKYWAKRLASAHPDDLEVLQSRSRARHTPYEEWDPLVLRRLEQLRLFPPEGLQRTPGPRCPSAVGPARLVGPDTVATALLGFSCSWQPWFCPPGLLWGSPVSLRFPFFIRSYIMSAETAPGSYDCEQHIRRMKRVNDPHA